MKIASLAALSTLLLGLVLPFNTRAQLVADGDTKVLDGTSTNIDATIYIGQSGSFTTLILTNGGSATNSQFAHIGLNSGSKSNRVIVTGNNSVWVPGTNQVLNVGNSGAYNQLLVTNGGWVLSKLSRLGTLATGNGNLATVTGPNSLWKTTSDLLVGVSGSSNRLLVADSGKVEALADFTVGSASSSDNQVTVDGGSLIVTNNGQANIHNGTLVINSGFLETAFLTAINGAAGQIDFNGGTWRSRKTTITTGSPLIVGNGTAAATFNLVGAGPHIFTDGLQISSNAMLNGAVTITGSVTNGGAVNPGASPGRLIVTGAFAQTAGGVLNIEITNTAPATGFDVLNVTGAVALAGTLNVTLPGGYYPAANATFTFLTNASRSGTFTTFNYPSNDVGMTVSYTATSATINVVNVHPVLPAIASQTSNEQTLFTYNAAATDADTPAQTLTYSLTNSPAGASINSSGVISWTPDEAQGPLVTNITVLVTDNGSPNLTVSRTFSIAVNEVNVAPVLNLPSNQSVNEETTFNGMATATDSDDPANSLTFALVSGPSGLTVSSVGVIAWTPTEAQGPNAYTVTVRLTDLNTNAVNAQQLSTTNSFVLTVNEVNLPPALIVPANQTLIEETPLAVSASATDPDSPANGLTFSLVSPPAGMTIDSGSGVINWTPTEAQGSNTYTITVVVTDDSPLAVNSQHLSDTNTFQVTVNESNRPPVLTLPADQVMTEETLLSVSASATDPDSPANGLTFSLESPPDGMTIDSESGVINWTPTEAQGSNTYTITVVVTDDSPLAVNSHHLSDTNTFQVTVNESNRPPVLTLPSDQVMTEETPLSLLATATDPDLPANTLTFALVSGPAGLTVSSGGAIDWLPTEAQGSNSYTILISVTDTNPLAVNATSLSVTSSFAIIVNESNRSPVLTLPGNQVMTEETLLSVSASATDPDSPANGLTFFLESPPAGMTIDSGSGAITWTPTEIQGSNNSYTITVVVTDDSPLAVNSQHLSDTNTFQVTVNESNRPPVLSLPTDQIITEETPLTVTATATDPDLPVNVLTFVLVSGPAGLTVSSSGDINWTPTETQGSNSYVITVSVSDTNPLAINATSLSVTSSFAIIVNESNRPPMLTLPADQVVTEEILLSVSASATDPDSPANGLTFSLVSPPDGMTIDSGNGAIMWTPTEIQGSNTYTITVVVTDDSPLAVNSQHLGDTNTFQVTVNESNRPPVLTLPADQVMTEETPLSLLATATDPDQPANALTFALVSGPTGLAVSSGGAIDWLPTEAQGSNSYTVLVSVTDTNPDAINETSFSVTNSFTVVVNESNRPPVLTLPADQVMTEETPLSLLATATDPDQPANSLTFALVSGPAGLTVSSGGAIDWLPTEAQGSNSYTILISVTDTNPLAINATSLSVTSSFAIIVNESNRPPVLTLPADQVMTEETPLSLLATATDPDLPANTLTFALVSGPAGLTVSSGGAIDWLPTEAQGSNSYTILVSVTDESPFAINATSLSVTSSFVIIVNESNRPPVLTLPADQVMTEETPLSLLATATDSDLPANALTFALVSGPTGLAVSTNGAIDWTPTETQGSNSYVITVSVTDTNPTAINETSFSVTNSFTVIVNESNHPPVLTVPADQTLIEETPLAVSASASDPDSPANGLTFSLVSPPAGMTIDSGNGAINWTPAEVQGSNAYTIRVVVTDDNPLAVNTQNISVTNTFLVTVNESNRPPVLTLPADTNTDELVLYSALATATDPDLPTNTLTFALVSGPAGMEVSTNGLIEWIPSEVQGPGTFVVTISVTDNNPDAVNEQHLSVTNSFTLVANEVNLTPALVTPIADTNGTYGTPFSYSFADDTWVELDNDQTISYVADNLPPGIEFDGPSRTFSGTPTLAGTYAVTVTTTDSWIPSLSSNATFNIVIEKAFLGVRAWDQTRVYGQQNVQVQISYYGFVYPDSPAVIDTPITAATLATPTDPPGAYEITLSGGPDDNYTLSLTNGTLTVTPATLLVRAHNICLPVNTTIPSLPVDLFSVVAGDNITATLTTTATNGSPPGAYPITVTMNDPDNRGSNYNITVQDAMLSVFTPTAEPLAALYLRTAPAGSYPSGLLPASDGRLYGFTEAGIYGVNKDGSGYSQLHTFTTGDYSTTFIFSFALLPRWALVEGPGGALYGSTSEIIFKVNKDGSGFTELHRYALATEGGGTTGELCVGSDGLLYGATLFTLPSGGSGKVFRLSPDGTGFTIIHEFWPHDTREYGYYPFSSVIEGSDGYLYGTTQHGGAGADLGLGSDFKINCGVLYRLSRDGANYSVLHSFPSGNQFPGSAQSLLQGSDGRIYGTSRSEGGVFAINHDGTGYTTLQVTYEFGFSLDLIEGTNGMLQGVTLNGGSMGGGTAFSLPRNGGCVEVTYDFNSYGYGYGAAFGPITKVTADTNGMLYYVSADHQIIRLYPSHAPKIVNPIPDQTGTYGYAFNYQVPLNTFTNEDAGETVSYYGIDLPPDVYFDPYTFEITGVPTTVGSNWVTIRAEDNGTPRRTTDASFAIVISKAPLTATASNVARAYRFPNPPLTFGYSGFRFTDTAAVIDSPVTIATTAVTSSPAGAYPITLSGGADDHYEVTLVNATLTVTDGQLIVRASSVCRNENEPNPPLTGELIGLVPGDNITATFTTTATNGSPPGVYPITVTVDDPENLLTNYSNVIQQAGLLRVLGTTDGPLGTARLHSFPANVGDGSSPGAKLLLASDDNIYGVTGVGGSADYGTIFSVNRDGSGYHILTNLTAASGIWYPSTGLLEGPDGALYGVADQRLYKINKDGSGLTLLRELDYYLDGGSLKDLCLGDDGKLYGVATFGGPNDMGTLFRINLDGSGYERLRVFDDLDLEIGSRPFAPLINGGDGKLYGSTVGGGANGSGAIFRLNPNDASLTALHAFQPGISATNGESSFAPLQKGSDGKLYGTTLTGGAFGIGTVFGLNPDGSGFVVLHSFAGAPGDGSYPFAGLVEGTNGLLHGMTYAGGATDSGTVFQVSREGGCLLVTHEFSTLNSGESQPYSGLITDTNGVLYGSTSAGGPGGGGVVFRLFEYQQLLLAHPIPDQIATVGYPFSYLIPSDTFTNYEPGESLIYSVSGQPSGITLDSLTGTFGGAPTEAGSNWVTVTVSHSGIAGLGTNTNFAFIVRGVLEITANSVSRPYSQTNPIFSGTIVGLADGDTITATYTTTATPCDPLGTYPITVTIQDPDNHLGNYLVITNDGVLTISLSAELETITSFDGLSYPYGPLMASNGVLYGVTEGGGTADVGALYQVNPDGSDFMVLHHFGVISQDGEYPSSKLLEGSSNALFGTTFEGGTDSYGTIFKINLDGSGYTVLHSFAGEPDDGAYPYGALIEGNDGVLYGTTGVGGGSDNGTIFKINQDGTGYAVLRSFAGGAGDGAYPYGLIQGTDGVLYGVTDSGGSYDVGTAYRLNRDGSGYTILRHFGSTTTDGAYPADALVQGTDGALYGTTYGGGDYDSGTIFKLNTNGSGFAVLRSLGGTETDVYGPSGPLTTGPDGALYGTSYNGGSNYCGTVFKINPDGSNFAVVTEFGPEVGDGGTYPRGLSLASDGRFYGVTYAGGPTDAGTLFRVQFTTLAAPSVATAIPDQSGVFGALFNYTFPAETFTDADPCRTMSFTASNLPPGIALDGPTRAFSGMPTNAGTFVVSVTATDDGVPPLSTNTTFNFVIARADSVIAVASSLNPALPGVSVTFTALVSVLPPSVALPEGSVQFRVDGVALGGLVLLTNGMATVETSTLPHGSLVVTAEFAGTTNFKGSTNSLSPLQIVNTPPSVTNLTAFIDINKFLVLSTNKLLRSAGDADGDPLAVTGASATSTNGGLVIFTVTNLTYTPVSDYFGADRVDFTVSDGYTNTTGHIMVTTRVGNTAGVNIVGIVDNGNSTVTVTFAGIPNRYYFTQSTTNLYAPVPPNWVTLGTNQANADGIWSYTDPVAPGERYYRSTGGTTVSP